MKKIADLKRDIDILDVLDRVGFSKNSPAWSRGAWGSHEMSVCCPFHGDNVASASVNIRLGLFKCFACDVAGDIVNLAKAHLNTDDTRAAVAWLEETFL